MSTLWHEKPGREVYAIFLEGGGDIDIKLVDEETYKSILPNDNDKALAVEPLEFEGVELRADTLMEFMDLVSKYELTVKGEWQGCIY